MMKNCDFDLDEEQYKQTSNPIYVWQSILRHCEKKDRFPDWVISYLHKSAKKLLAINNPKDKTAYYIKKALDFKTGKYFSQYHKPKPEEQIYWRVLEERFKRNYGDKVDIYADVGDEFNLSADAIKKIFFEVKKGTDAYKEINKQEMDYWMGRES